MAHNPAERGELSIQAAIRFGKRALFDNQVIRRTDDRLGGSTARATLALYEG